MFRATITKILHNAFIDYRRGRQSHINVENSYRIFSIDKTGNISPDAAIELWASCSAITLTVTR